MNVTYTDFGNKYYDETTNPDSSSKLRNNIARQERVTGPALFGCFGGGVADNR